MEIHVQLQQQLQACGLQSDSPPSNTDVWQTFLSTISTVYAIEHYIDHHCAQGSEAETASHLSRQDVHTLRNLLTNILGSAMLLRREVHTMECPPCIEDIERIDRAGYQLLNLISDLATDEFLDTTMELQGTSTAAGGSAAIAAANLIDALARILIIDDNNDTSSVMVRELAGQHYAAIVAADGEQALDLVQRQRFDLILLDINLPQNDGIEVLRQLKSEPATCETPVIVISGYADHCNIAHCLELGAEDYLIKPYNAVLLEARINASLERVSLREKERAYLRSRLLRLGTHNPGYNGNATANGNSGGNLPLDPTIDAILDALEQEQSRRQQVEDELRTLNATLEQRVAERNHDLAQRARELARSEQMLQQQTGLLQSILDGMGDGVIVVDAQRRVTLSNPVARQVLAGLPEHLLIEATPDCPVLLPDRQTPCPTDELPLARAIRGDHVDAAELYLPAIAGHSERWLSVTARPLPESVGNDAGGVAVLRDVSSAKQTEAALRASEERYALAARGANDGLWDWDLIHNQVYYSARWKNMLGCREDEIGNSPDEWFERVHSDDRERLQIQLVAHSRKLLTHFELEYRILHQDGGYRWMVCRGLAVWNAHGQATRMAGSQTDITDRKMAEKQLIYDALHDSLTGLPNRSLFMDRLDHALELACRTEFGLPLSVYAVIFLDLDRFKNINDGLGHLVGDRLLIHTAERLRTCLRSSDTIARLGGDEFAILLEEIQEPDRAVQVAERIQKVLAQPFYIDGNEIFTSASIGITLGHQRYQQAEELLRDADMAMYHAKLNGKAGYAVFTEAMHASIVDRLKIENDLRRAVERQEFRLHYEPIVELESGNIIGFEALIRWYHPERGMVSPAAFIPIAEETGLILPIGKWVLQEACRQMQEWHQTIPTAHDYSINVNVSARQWMHSNLIGQVQQTLRDTGLEAQYLRLEITENVLIDNGEMIKAVMVHLQQLGVAICLDDFGTGYSSLSYLHNFPVDILKIDRSFIGRIGANGENAELVQTIMAMARALSITAIAEGAETEHQLQALRKLECRFGQGWYFSRAVDSAAATRLIIDQEQLKRGLIPIRS
jgi:diguanylate cyclase (GGDEF)-like protein/PAS domain S-box-containing protein